MACPGILVAGKPPFNLDSTCFLRDNSLFWPVCSQNITVYDPTLNRFQTIGGIPDAVVFTAGVLNKIEEGWLRLLIQPPLPIQNTPEVLVA